jgi:hypothetical protein
MVPYVHRTLAQAPVTNPISHVIDRLFEQTFVPYATTGVADGGSTDVWSG